MWKSDPDERSLPDWIVTAYDALEAEIHERDGGVSIEEAQTVLLEAAAEELALHPDGAEYAIQRLHDRGYLYEVDSELVVTEPIMEGAKESERQAESDRQRQRQKKGAETEREKEKNK